MNRFIAILFVLMLGVTPLPARQSGPSATIVTIEGVQYYVHPVTAGETVYSLSRRYGVPEETLVANNPQIARGLRADMVLKIPVIREGEKELNKRQLRRTFDTHEVRAGETLYAISRQYGISVGTLMEDNPGLDPSRVGVGQKIRIRKASQGDTSGWEITEELERYRDALNSVTHDGQYYLVKSGDTLYSLAKMFGVSVESIEAANDIRDGIKAGAMIKIPGESLAPDKVEVDQFGFTHVRHENPEDSVAYLREQIIERRRRGGETGIADISERGSLNISLLLPMEGTDEKLDERFLEFYQGALLGAEDLKEQGISVELNLYNTSRSGRTVADIVRSEEFQNSDLIIGPVYEDGLFPVIAFAETKGVPVVSPLSIHESVPSPVLYQMAPVPQTKYDKLRAMLARPGVNVVYLATQYPDAELDAALRQALPPGARTANYTPAMTGAQLEEMFDKNAAENIFVVSCLNMHMADQILGKISSMHNNLTARSLTTSKVRVVGSPQWAWFPGSTVDRDLYFKLGVCYVTNYHVDRSDARTRDFDTRYILSFGQIPPSSPGADPAATSREARVYPYAYRGYDAVKLFGGALMTRGEDFTWKVNGTNQELLQVTYRMDQSQRDGDFRNTNWIMVCYQPDYTITVQ